MVVTYFFLRILTDMEWEGRIVSAGEWVECKLSVASSVGENFSWVGQLMMRPEEWRDFADRMKLVEVSTALWVSAEEPGPEVSAGVVSGDI